jgi:hypothetical protein
MSRLAKDYGILESCLVAGLGERRSKLDLRREITPRVASQMPTPRTADPVRP